MHLCAIDLIGMHTRQSNRHSHTLVTHVDCERKKENRTRNNPHTVSASREDMNGGHRVGTGHSNHVSLSGDSFQSRFCGTMSATSVGLEWCRKSIITRRAHETVILSGIYLSFEIMRNQYRNTNGTRVCVQSMFYPAYTVPHMRRRVCFVVVVVIFCCFYSFFSEEFRSSCYNFVRCASVVCSLRYTDVREHILIQQQNSDGRLTHTHTHEWTEWEIFLLHHDAGGQSHHIRYSFIRACNGRNMYGLMQFTCTIFHALFDSSS